MLLLELAEDRIKLALLLAQRAADAGIRVDLSDQAVFKLACNRAGRAALRAHHAADALRVVDHRQVVLHRDRAKLARLLALAAADAADLAALLDVLGLVVGAAGHGHHAVRRLHGQHVLGTRRDALLTALALLLVDNGDLAHRIDMDRVKRAGALTRAQTQARIRTGLGSSLHQRRSQAILDAVVVILGLTVTYAALAVDRGDHARTNRGLHAHDLAHLCRNGRAADRALADLGLPVGHRGSIAVAARESAGAAVRARKALAQRIRLGVGGHRKDLAGHCEQGAKDQAQNAEHHRGRQNRSKIHSHTLLKSGR